MARNASEAWDEEPLHYNKAMILFSNSTAGKDQKNMEGRRHKRAQVRVGCWIVLQDGESCCCSTIDISDNGISIATNTPLPVGQTVCLQFYTPHSASPIAISAEVVWSSADHDHEGLMGLKFLDITCDEMKTLTEMSRQMAYRESHARKFQGHS